MKKRLYGLLLAILTIGLVACGEKEEKIHSRTELFMGTAINIKIYDGNEKVLDKIFEEVEEIEDKASINKGGTEVDNINKNAGIKSVKVSNDVFEIIKTGMKYSSMAEGNYDITVGPLVKLWSIGLPEARKPSDKEIGQALEKINYKNLELNEEKKEIYLKEKGMLLDLGSIAKGYTADRITEILREEGVNKAIVDLGGNIYAFGEKNENEKWKIGIQNPFSDRGDVVGAIKVKDKSIVTTGIYERFLERDGEKYHHILNPKTGYPYESNIGGVSIISDKSIDGDALSTLVFTLGIEKGLQFVEGIEGVECIFVDKDKNIYLSSGIKSDFELINTEFKVK
ncbi:MAG: FAD:protein FMN transferase [Clostridium sp.]|uniref:FAD:protein FMN transferase n=1 Tax=Clostridium sp. TaxID=1506 RepID=UPI003F3D565A